MTDDAPPKVKNEEAMDQNDRWFKEWEKAEDVAMHFTDLLMRLRVFALPFIVTVVGAGSFFGSDSPVAIEARWGLIAAFAFAVALLIGLPVVSRTVSVIGELLSRQRDGSNDEARELSGWELILWWSVVLSFAIWGGLVCNEQPQSFSFSAPLLTFGGMLLFSIFLLDRFYYLPLLLGAVKRAEDLETFHLDLKLSQKIREEAPPWTYKLLPSLLYLGPVLVLVNIGLGVMTFSGPDPTGT